MMKFIVNVYLYSASQSFSLACGGYNCTSLSQWIKTFAQISGNTASNNRVRFGHDGSKCVVVIGDTDSIWSYPKVSVRDFQGGHNSFSFSQWATGWSISFETDLSGYSLTVDYSDALLDAKAILNQGALATQSFVGASDCDTTIISDGKIITGLLTASNIQTGTLNASTVSVINLDASNITTGTLSATRIGAGSISATKLDVDSLSAISANLGTITAGSINIGSGTFSVSSAGAFTATSATITAPSGGYVKIENGADLIMNGNGTDTSIIKFKPDPTNSNTWIKIEAGYGGSYPHLNILPNATSGTGDLNIGDTTNRWKMIQSNADLVIRLNADDGIDTGQLDLAPDYLNCNVDGPISFNDFSVAENGDIFVYRDIKIGSSTTYLYKSSSDIYWYNGSSGSKLSNLTYSDVGAASSSDSRFLTSIQKTDLTNGGDTNLHVHNTLDYNGTTLRLYAASAATLSYADFKPSTGDAWDLGDSSNYWAKIYGADIYYRTVTAFDVIDDLQVIDNLKSKGKSITISGQEIPIVDHRTVPDYLTNKEKLRKEIRKESGNLISDKDFDIMLNDELKNRIHYNMGGMISLAHGGIRQLNKEVTEDIMEQLNSLIENLTIRVSILEKERTA
jgi:hypothetical protein